MQLLALLVQNRTENTLFIFLAEGARNPDVAHPKPLDACKPLQFISCFSAFVVDEMEPLQSLGKGNELNVTPGMTSNLSGGRQHK